MRRFARDRRGAAAMIIALSAPALFGAAALAVDLGAVYMQSRRLQGMADAAALAAAHDLDRARSAARQAVASSEWSGRVDQDISLGRYTPEPSIAPDRRFQVGAPAPNAAHVRLSAHTPLYFAAMLYPRAHMRLERSALAAHVSEAGIQLGSRLLAVRGGAANALLSALTGSSISLSVMDYQALIGADVDLFSYFEALRTQTRLEAMSFNRLLAREIETESALAALAHQLAHSGERRAAAAVEELALASKGLGAHRLERLFALGDYGAQDRITPGGARARVSALDLAHALLELANGGRQVALDMDVRAPGIADVSVWLAIGERPHDSPLLTLARDGESILRTAQMRLYLDAKLADPFGGAARVRLPILVELASARARLENLDCDGRRARSLSVEVTPSVGAVSIADIDRARLDDFRRELARAPAALVRAPLLRVDASAHADLGGLAPRRLIFSEEEIAARAVKRAATGDLAEASISSLLRELDIDIRAIGLGLTEAGVARALTPALIAAAPVLDDLVNELTGALGVNIGEADVRVNGARCAGVALVG